MTSKPAQAQASYDLGRVLLPLRAFLGFTFCFAGLQKLANPGFFDAANAASIQSQLAGAARRSPIHALISPLTHVAVPLGILIALGELAIGVGTLLGLRARLAAAGGLALSLMLFLTVSFHSAPYYTGADIVFVFAWTPLMLAGAGSVLSLDATIAQWADRQASAARRQARRSGIAAREASRREVVLRGMVTAAVAAGSLVVGGLAAGLGRLAGGTTGKAGGTSLPTAAAPARSAAARPRGSATAKPGKAPAGTAIGPARDVPVGQAASFQDPATGDPSIVIQPRSGTFLAFDPTDPGSVTRAFDRLAAELLDYVHANQRLYHVLFHDVPGHREQAIEPLRHLVARLLSQAMDQGALTRADTDLLARFVLDGLHAAMLPLAHQDEPRVPAGLSEILRRLLAPARTS